MEDTKVTPFPGIGLGGLLYQDARDEMAQGLADRGLTTLNPPELETPVEEPPKRKPRGKPRGKRRKPIGLVKPPATKEQKQETLSTVLELTGIGTATAGVALFSIGAALIVLGICLVVLGFALSTTRTPK